jgi:hypothetical protein
MPNGQTCIQYGTVRLYHCQTRRIEQRPVMDKAGVNLKCWRFVVHVTGYLHGFPDDCAYSSINEPTESGEDVLVAEESAADAHIQARWRLPPRQAFKMALGCTTSDIDSGTTILEAYPMTLVAAPVDLAGTGLSNYDVNDGPRCTQFDVVHVSSNNIFRVEASFIVHLVQCSDDGTAEGNLTGVLAHRWASIDSLDHNLRLTRTYRGLLELATSNFSPHWFRFLVVPPLQPGMRRDHMDFVATEDGKRLQYTIKDIEVAVSAPPPARRWSVEHTEHSLSKDAMKVTSQCSVSLEGDRTVDKGALILLGLAIVNAKVQGTAPGGDPEPPGTVVFNDISITDYTGDANMVRVSASCWRPANLVNGLAIRTEGFKKQIAASDLPGFAEGYDPTRSAGGYDDDQPVYEGPVPLTGIFRTYLQTSCISIGGINNGNQLSDGNGATSAMPKTTISAATAPTLGTTDVPWYSDSHKVNMYTTWQMESIYKTEKLRAAMPIASVPYSGSGPDTRIATSVISLSAPQCRRIVRIQAERTGAWPEFPDPESMTYATTSGVRQFALKTKLLGGSVTKSADGKDIYHARAEFVFALQRQPAATEVLKFGVNKWSNGPETVSTGTLTNS